MVKISAFADEVSPDIAGQMEFINKQGLEYLEIRFINSCNIVKLNSDELKEIAGLLKDNNIKISAIGSPIGKVRIDENFNEHFELFKHTVDIAMQLNSQLIRIFSYYPPLNKDINDYQDEIIDRMRKKLDFIRGLPIILTHENEARIYGQTSQKCRYMAEKLNSQQFRLTYDPANFVWSMGIKDNVQRCLPQMLPYVNHVHIKDWSVGSQVGSIPGMGDGQIPQLLKELKKIDYRGFLTLEPHLEKGEQFGGSTGSRLFVSAIDALRKICEEAGLEYN
jgi:3-dehydroshikimate dehydratase